MTKNQRISLMAELWPNACRSQGWREEDRDLRLYVCSIAVARDIKNIQQFRNVLSGGVPIPVLKSTNDIADNKQFTKVKGLLLMLADDLRGPSANHDNQARTKRWVVQQQIKCLALYVGNAEAYVAQIIRDKFKGGSAFVPLTLDDLSARPYESESRTVPSQLDQLIRTLAGRLHNKKTGFRVKAGHTIHEMCVKAGVKCHCAECEANHRDAETQNQTVEEPF